jgi:pimeloyl-ACP methyl ester carboxylesterase
VRLYAHHHPDEVAGLILVDAMHQDQFEIFGPLFPPPRQSDPPELTAVRSFWQGGWRSPDATSEKIDFVSSIRQAREITSLGGIRLHVLIAGTFLNQPLVPLQFRAQLQERWETLQMEFIKLSTRATYSLELRSGHFLQREAPWAVIDAVRALIAGPC